MTTHTSGHVSTLLVDSVIKNCLEKVQEHFTLCREALEKIVTADRDLQEFYADLEQIKLTAPSDYATYLPLCNELSETIQRSKKAKQEELLLCANLLVSLGENMSFTNQVTLALRKLEMERKDLCQDLTVSVGSLVQNCQAKQYEDLVKKIEKINTLYERYQETSADITKAEQNHEDPVVIGFLTKQCEALKKELTPLVYTE